MRNDCAIRLQNVSKIYKLHGSQRDQLVDVLGLQRIGIRTKTVAKEFIALNNITLDVPRGHRTGIVGRNGAGKTTLLKLVCGNFACSSGTIEVNGEVQALMNVGLGFHPEYTGWENVEASLQYNGLRRDEFQQAMQDIIDFCELGNFLNQPFKTYSLGMQARLMFAAATAIRPDILIIDEVLGAGDAFFVAKSKKRIEKLVSSGCTMLLVSHSMQQVLELCNEAIWLEEGKVRMRGVAFDVVKAYEEFVHGPARNVADVLEKRPTEIGNASMTRQNSTVDREQENRWPGKLKLQEPAFLPHAARLSFPDIPAPLEFRYPAAGGVSRWAGTGELWIVGATLVTDHAETNILGSMCPAKVLINVRVALAGEFSCRYGFTAYDQMGRCVLDILSPEHRFKATTGDHFPVEMVLNPLQLGPGEYTMSLSIHGYEPIERLNATKRYDLANRSLAFSVNLRETLGPIEAQFYHSAEWNFALMPNNDSLRPT